MSDTERHFNCFVEPWIPVVNHGLASLQEIFRDEKLRALGGTPLQKIALLKLLVAIAQAAKTPEDNRDWRSMGPQGMARASLEYLKRRYDDFWLHGERPFLQMPAVQKSKLLNYGALIPEIASGNTTVHTAIQVEIPLTEAERALLLLVTLSCCFSGKNVDKTIVLSPGFVKSATARSGPALCSRGLLHSFLVGHNLQETIWLNLLTQEDIRGLTYLPDGIGTPPWEHMPEGEDCPIAQKLRHSLMGRLVPLARFCLLEEKGIHYVEGIQHPDYQQGILDPSMTGDLGGKKPKMLWADPEKRPWRLLTSLLSFLQGTNQEKVGSFHCVLLNNGIPRLQDAGLKTFGIWCGGIKTRCNAGQQYLSGMDDAIDSEIFLSTSDMKHSWYMNLKRYMEVLDEISKVLFGAVSGYYKEVKSDNASLHAKTAVNIFWQSSEKHFNALSEACESVSAACDDIIRLIVNEANSIYAVSCPQNTARELQLWAKHRPHLYKFLPSRSKLEV